MTGLKAGFESGEYCGSNTTRSGLTGGVEKDEQEGLRSELTGRTGLESGVVLGEYVGLGGGVKTRESVRFNVERD